MRFPISVNAFIDLIRQAFAPIRDFRVREELLPCQASLLKIEKLTSPVEDSEKFYPPQQDVHDIIDWDQHPPQKEISEEGLTVQKGRGHHKPAKIRERDERKALLERWESYEQKKGILGDKRNSYSKTNPDATFMYMKDDHMRNGQLKHNRKFVRFLTAGNVKVACELFLLAISQNIRKAIIKCNIGRLENHILQPASLLNF